MDIITGYRAEPHVDSQQDRNINMGLFGDGTYILDVGSKLAATVISANEVQIADGAIVCEGCTAEVEYGTTESLTIANGTQGMYRTDLIVARYTKNSGTGVESMALAVVTGTAAASDPATPSYNSGAIADGDSPVDFPLYKVNLDGISITSVDCLVDVIGIKSLIESANTSITAIQTRINSLLTRVDINCGAHTCATDTGTVNFNIDISSYIPEGYKAFDVRCGTTQDYQFYCWMCDFVSGSNNQTVAVRIQKRSGTGGTIHPWICVTCIKEVTA